MTSSRLKALIVVAAILLSAVAGRAINVQQVAGKVKGDESTYIAMAFSLADDGDLRWEREDYTRFAAMYDIGPDGIFLKRSYHPFNDQPVPVDQYVSFGKALAYPVAAAPFVFLGGLGGMLVFNWILLAGCLWCAGLFASAVAGRKTGWLVAIAFFSASVVPVFGAWLTSEIFNFALVFFAYFLWLYKKVSPEPAGRGLRAPWTTWLAAVLLGIATFSKATHAALVLPLVLDALFERRLGRAVVVAGVCVAAALGLFGVNKLITGEANYQGARNSIDRKSFNNAYPFDDKGTRFDAGGNPMTTNDADTDRVLASDMLSQLPVNTMYFMIGRDAGMVPFYFPGVVLLLGWLTQIRRAPLWQWGIVIAVVGSIGGLLIFAPDSWNGGGGPPGNRYFLSIYPPLLFLVWRGMRPRVGVVSFAGLAFVGMMVVHPFEASAATWRNVERAPLRWLPIELTLINDLPPRLNGLRAPILFVKEPTVLLYHMDGNTYSAEGDGFWIAGGAGTDTIIRTDHPIKRVDFILSSPIENTVTGSLAGRSFSAAVHRGQDSRVQVGGFDEFRYHQSYAYVLHMETTKGFVPAESEPGSKDTRNLGVFVRPKFTY